MNDALGRNYIYKLKRTGSAPSPIWSAWLPAITMLTVFSVFYVVVSIALEKAEEGSFWDNVKWWIRLGIFCVGAYMTGRPIYNFYYQAVYTDDGRIGIASKGICMNPDYDNEYACNSTANCAWVNDMCVNRELKDDFADRGILGRTSDCLLYTSPSPRDYAASRMPSSA